MTNPTPQEENMIGIVARPDAEGSNQPRSRNPGTETDQHAVLGNDVLEATVRRVRVPLAPSQNMICRVARALWQNDEVRRFIPWETVVERTRQEFRQSARAAIEAMREPDLALGRVLVEHSNEYKIDPARLCIFWQAMIDEALK